MSKLLSTFSVTLILILASAFSVKLISALVTTFVSTGIGGIFELEFLKELLLTFCSISSLFVLIKEALSFPKGISILLVISSSVIKNIKVIF